MSIAGYDRVERLNPSMSEADNNSVDRIPAPLFYASSSNSAIGFFLCSDSSDRYLEHQTFKGEWLFRFKIPHFQRDLCWTEEQKIRFIESAYMGFNLGTYVVNKIEWSGNLIHEFDDFLIDGLQRISAIRDYVESSFPVFGLHWKDLSRRERRRFENIEFTKSVVNIKDEAKLRELYNRLSFGGTPHREDQRA